MRWHVAFRPLEFREHRTHVRVFDSALKQAPGLHHLMAGIVDRGGCVIEAADKRILVGVLRPAREIFRNLDAGNVRADRFIRPTNLDGGIRLGVPGVELRRAADQHQMDAVDVFLAVVNRALRLKSENLRESEAKKTEAARV